MEKEMWIQLQELIRLREGLTGLLDGMSRMGE